MDNLRGIEGMFGKVSSLLINGPPNDGESFVGFLIRMAEWNKHEWLSWILQKIKIISGRPIWIPSFAFNDSLDLDTLAELTDTPIAELKSLLYLPVAGSGLRHLIFGKPLPQYVIRPLRPKICPACLRESNYYRKIWDLAPITACPIHKCLLIGVCPKCSKHISWNRNKVSSCRCEYDLRDAIPRALEDIELRFARQIHYLCKVSDSSVDMGRLTLPNPLMELDLEDLVSAVVFMAGQSDRTSGGTGKYLFRNRTNDEIHTLLMKGYSVFEDWPRQYHGFLDQVRAQSKKSSLRTGLWKDFGPFHRRLYHSLPSKSLDFMRIEYETYLRSRWDGGFLTEKSLRFSKVSARGKKYFTRTEAVRFLQVADNRIDQLTAEGLLHPVIRSRHKNKLTLFDISDCEKAKQYLEQLLNLKEVGEFLEISWTQAKVLVAEGCLTPVYGPAADGYKIWMIRRTDVEKLLDDIESRIVEPKTHAHKAFSLSNTLAKICVMNFGTGKLVKAILDGKISPCGKTVRKGLDRFVFAKEHIEDFVESFKQDIKEGAISLREAAEILAVSAANVYHLVKRGLLAAQKIRIRKRLTLQTTRDALSLFNSTYLLIAKINKEVGTSSRVIAEVLSQKGIFPVSGPTVDGGQQYVFKRSDLKDMSLSEVVNQAKTERDPRGKRYAVINAEQAAELLEVDLATIHKLVESGKLKIFSGSPQISNIQTSYLFYRAEVEKYQRATTDYSKLVSSVEAAKIFEQGYGSFRKQWVKTKRLIPVKFNTEFNKYYFHREDVEALAEIKKKTIPSPEAAAILGIQKKALRKLTIAGKIKPFSGPHVDGYGHNMYLQSDVERLAEEMLNFKKAGSVSTSEASLLLGVHRSVIHWLLESGKLKPVVGPHVNGYYKNMYLRSDIEKLKEKSRPQHSVRKQSLQAYPS
jgi:predicted site-specific integrase-resolvase